MDFNFTKEQLAIKNMISEFADKEVKPYAADADQKEIFPEEQIKKLNEYKEWLENEGKGIDEAISKLKKD